MTLHPEAAAFLRAIADSPAEDTPRLAFADWLDEHGEPERAEFVRVQCELAAWPGCELKAKPGDVDCNQWNYLLGEGRVMTWCKPCVRRNELCRRELELWESKRGDEWVIRGVKPDAPDWIVHEAVLQNHIASSSTANVIVWSRGFLSRIRCSWADCAAHLDAILADPWVPGLDEVELTTWPELQRVGSDDEYLAGRPTNSYRDDGGWELLLQQRWPAVRSWKLPSETRGEPIITPAAQEIIDAAREIVRRAELDVGAIRQDILPRGTFFWPDSI